MGKIAINKLGLWANVYTESFDGQIKLAQRLETLGYGALWLPDFVSRDPFVSLSAMARETDQLFLATGIANIYTRSPLAMAGTRQSLGELAGGRLILGLGVSHTEIVSHMLNMNYDKPISTMRNYLEAMSKAQALELIEDGVPSNLPDIGIVVLAALRDKMMNLAGKKADGAHPYLTTPEHTARARDILGPDSFLAPEQKVLLEKDPSKARAIARQHLAVYLGLQNYKNNFLTMGFSEEDFANGGSDRLIDGLVAWGDETSIMKHLEAHWRSGADHLCIQTLRPDGKMGYDPKAIEAFAPKGL